MSTSNQNTAKLRLLHLKVKLMSIGVECAIIHREERRAKARARWARQNPDKVAAEALSEAMAAFWSLRNHRVNLKFHQRYDHLAYGFLRGVPYAVMEHRVGTQNKPDLGRVREAAMRFSGVTPAGFTPEQAAAWAVWAADAEAHLESPPAKPKRVKVERPVWTREQIQAARAQAKKAA